ncbi:YrdB family protein [Paenibacillus rhizophilus]|nr:YrdB family protein [Paenibacillus rhizophilus]
MGEEWNMIGILQMLNLSLRFLLEIVVLIVYGFWGYRLGGSTWSRTLFCLGLPLFAAVVWAMLGAPRASYALPAPLHLLLEILMFGTPIVLLILMNRPGQAAVYGIAALVNKLLLVVWNQ